MNQYNLEKSYKSELTKIELSFDTKLYSRIIFLIAFLASALFKYDINITSIIGVSVIPSFNSPEVFNFLANASNFVFVLFVLYFFCDVINILIKNFILYKPKKEYFYSELQNDQVLSLLNSTEISDIAYKRELENRSIKNEIVTMRGINLHNYFVILIMKGLIPCIAHIYIGYIYLDYMKKNSKLDEVSNYIDVIWYIYAFVIIAFIFFIGSSIIKMPKKVLDSF